MRDSGLYAILLWVHLSCGHFALFARVTFRTMSRDVKFCRRKNCIEAVQAVAHSWGYVLLLIPMPRMSSEKRDR